MGKKRNRDYVSRDAKLSKFRQFKRPNVAQGIAVLPAKRGLGEDERFFNRKLFVPSDDSFLTALAFLNDVCVLAVPHSMNAVRVTFNLSPSSCSGRMKKVCKSGCML